MLLKVKDPRKIMCAGMMALAVGGSVPMLLRHVSAVSEDMVDGLHGMLLGVAIGLMLLGLHLQSRARRCGEEN